MVFRSGKSLCRLLPSQPAKRNIQTIALNLKDPHSGLRSSFASIALIFSIVVCSACKVENLEGYLPQIYHSNTFPRCTYAVYRDRFGCDDGTILYYLHGLGGDENSWPLANREVIKCWRKIGIPAPVVVAVTFGPEWYILPAGTAPETIPVESFVRNLIPEIEKKLGGKAKRRLLYGFSMGGENADQLLFRFPEVFDKAVLVSPSGYPFYPDASNAEIEAFAQSIAEMHSGLFEVIRKVLHRDGFKRAIIAAIMNNNLRSYAIIPEPSSWQKADIFKNMQPPPPGKRISVYISSGKQDTGGFYPGALLLAEKASALGYVTYFDALDGGHFALRSEKIASFLTGVPPYDWKKNRIPMYSEHGTTDRASEKYRN